MRETTRRAALRLAALAIMACGGGAEDVRSGATGAGCAITDAQLCRLQCWTTTEAEALAVLGNASASVHGGSGDMLEYNCHLGGANMFGYTLTFAGSPAQLNSVTRSAMGNASGALPSCFTRCP